ncbi:hypothetical protein INT43_005412 [Umbelopsis isabellina]|uniref:Uncharacterized protein n=1 Tax=Mortierella isabellina TaxID=91625 RepID=A0A8H7PMI6_MORIS|nr:hypothetical protein INT43_005412 [Umbelopsis isabellina]
MKSATFRYSLIKRLAVVTRPFGYATRPPHPCPVRPPKNRATPMAVDNPPLHVLMDVDPWWWGPDADSTLDEEASASPTVMDWEPGQKDRPPPVPVQRVRLTLPPASRHPNRPKLKPLRARREAVPQAAPFSTQQQAATSRAAGSSGRGMNCRTGALAQYQRSSSQQLVATEMPPPNTPVEVDRLECLVRSAQSPAQKAPSPFGSPRPRPRGLVAPTQEGLTQVDREMLSQLDVIRSAPSSPTPRPQLECHDAQVLQQQIQKIREEIALLEAEDDGFALAQPVLQCEDVLGEIQGEEMQEEHDPFSAGPRDPSQSERPTPYRLHRKCLSVHQYPSVSISAISSQFSAPKNAILYGASDAMVSLYHDAYGQMPRPALTPLRWPLSSGAIYGPREKTPGGWLFVPVPLDCVWTALPVTGFLALQNWTLAVFRDPGSLDAYQLLFCLPSDLPS